MLDYLNVRDLLSDEERLIQSTVRDFLDREIAPHIEHWWNEGLFPKETMQKLGEMGLLGSNLPEQYGGAGVSNIAYGVMMYEIERIDSGLRSAASVQGALVMYPIHAFGSEEQKQKYLPELASGRMIGCFGLTEPDGGSDPGAMRTRARLDGDHYVLNGNKMWITNSPLADIAVVWAKDDEDTIRGFIVPTDTPGFSAPKITSKMSLRASVTGEIVLEDVRIPRDHLLPLSGGLKSPLMCLTQARYGISWGALGALETVYTCALEYAKTRTTFGKPIGSRQLVQEKLVYMLSEHQKGLLLALRLGQLKDQNRLKFGQVSVAKRNNVRVALESARLAREILGGNGITTEYPVVRHMLNLETVDTYEGTHDIHTLIVGRDITGLNALE